MKTKIKGIINFFEPIIKNTKNWPILIFNRLNLLNNKILIYKFKDGSNLKIDNVHGKFKSSGMATITDIFIKKTYNPSDMKINAKDTIIDIGANVGIFSIYGSMKAPLGKVYSFEPFEKHFSKLNKNIKLNNLKNIKIFNLAVDKDDVPKNFFVSETHTGAHSLIKNDNSSLKTKTRCISLENVFKKNKIKVCDFMKIDCEGGEYNILYGASDKILNKIKKISLEFDNIDDKKRNGLALKNFLIEKGFNVNILGERNPNGIIYAKK